MRFWGLGRSTTALAAVALLWVAACDLRPPHARVVITDPEGLAADAAAITVGTASTSVQQITLTHALPISIVITADGGEGTRKIWIEALAADGHTLGRGSATLELKTDQGGASFEIALGRPCESSATCDDAVFCNGAEACEDRVCRRSAEPCPRSIIECGEVGCDEAARVCTCTYVGAIEKEPNDSSAQATPVPADPGTGATRSIRAATTGERDVDYFSIEVPDGWHLDAYVSIPGFDDCVTRDVLDLALIDSDGTTALAGSGLARADPTCGRISPATTRAAYRLPGGRYYLVVSPVRQVDSYFLNVRTIAPGCGNGVLDEGEACDDGDAEGGDGCTPSCALEIAATLRPPGGNAVLELAAQDVVRVVRVDLDRSGQSITATVAQSEGGCASGTGLELLDASGNSLGFVVGRGDLGCTTLQLREDAFASGLVAGSYYLVVFSTPGAFGRLDVELQVKVVDPVCGNDFVEVAAGEQCDDRNVTAGDGCGPTCRFEISTRISPPGGTAILRVPGNGYAVAEVNITAPGQSITATTSTPPTGCDFDSYMTLVAPDLSVLGSRYGAGLDVCGSIDFPRDGWARDLPVGRYFLVLESSYAEIDLALALSILNPACSNGAVERSAGETCDDGNLLTGDGCDASCRLEGVAFEEREPNNALAQSMAVEAAIGKRLEVVGRISPAGDVDYFSFEIPPGRTATLMARTYGQRGDYLSCEGDTVLTLLDAAGVTLAENDDIFGVGCSTIDGAGLIDTGAANLGPGQYHLRVREYFGTRAIPAYVLQIELK